VFQKFRFGHYRADRGCQADFNAAHLQADPVDQGHAAAAAQASGNTEEVRPGPAEVAAGDDEALQRGRHQPAGMHVANADTNAYLDSPLPVHHAGPG
jgi:hypothetical protein